MGRMLATAGAIAALFLSSPGDASPSRPEFGAVDADGNGDLTRREAKRADLANLVASWSVADTNQNGWIDPAEYSAFMAEAGPSTKPLITVGKGRFKSPETVLWDERQDVYLVSNVNGALTALDDNGFIARVAPHGAVKKLKWIDAAPPELTLNGPKGMIFWDDRLVVADVKTVRFFDRASGKHLRDIPVPKAYMLNDLALDAGSGTLYVTDTGGDLAGNPGAVYRISRQGRVETVAAGDRLDRPDGLEWHDGELLVTPFASTADEVYRLTLGGDRRSFGRVPQPQLDGLLKLPDGDFAVTSWQGNAVYRVSPRGDARSMVQGVTTPAQIGFDARRERLLVPVLEKHELRIYSVP